MTLQKIKELMKREDLSVNKIAGESGVLSASLRQFLRDDGKERYLHPNNEKKIIAWSKGKITPWDLRPYLKGKTGKAA